MGIAHHRKTLGNCIMDGTRVSCKRPHIAFDQYLYPVKRNSATSVADVSQSHNSETTGHHQGCQRPAKDHAPGLPAVVVERACSHPVPQGPAGRCLYQPYTLVSATWC